MANVEKSKKLSELDKNFEKLLNNIKKNDRKADLNIVRRAFEYAKSAHAGQKRKTGEDYIIHPLATAYILSKLKLDLPTIIAALLHDVPEDTNFNLVDIEKNFGKEVAKLVAGVTKLKKIRYGGEERFAENLRKMMISFAEDIRVVLIKIADKLHNLKTLFAVPKEEQKRIAKEVIEIYAPLADRLGMGQIKGELEDLAFPYAFPEEYGWFNKEVIPRYKPQTEYIRNVIDTLKKELAKNKIKIISIHGRPKHYYSLYEKLQRPQYNRDINMIYDLVAVRLIVPTPNDCYRALGVIHELWKPLPGRIKDYISQPKPNYYRSLHTTVIALEGKIAEIQIRDPQMHDQAEYGVAAHWHYKALGKNFFSRLANLRGFHFKGYQVPKKLQWVKELADLQREVKDSKQFLKSLKIDALKKRIFIFTPRGDVIDLPEDATPIDFAYHIHTEIGDKCAGAKINGQIAKLNDKLANGDMVEILIDKSRKGPNRDWLKYAKTAIARNKIRQWMTKNRV